MRSTRVVELTECTNMFCCHTSCLHQTALGRQGGNIGEEELAHFHHSHCNFTSFGIIAITKVEFFRPESTLN